MRATILFAIVLAFAAAGCATEAQEVSPQPTSAVNSPPVGYGVVTLSPEPLSGLYIKAIDPYTGEDIAGREPIELGHHGMWALSPDGSRMALAWSPTGDDDGPEQLHVIDLARWDMRDLGYEGRIRPLGWSPDGERIIVAEEEIACDNGIPVPDCEYAKHDIVTVDADSGEVEARTAFPVVGVLGLSPDARTLYLFGAELDEPYAGDDSGVASLYTFDIESGDVRSELEFPNVIYGARQELDEAGEEFDMHYFPGTALSPDGRLLYIAHADSERIDVVDLDEMRVVRSGDIHEKTSVIEDILSRFAGKAEAKGNAPTTSKGLTVSPDGRTLYITSSRQRPVYDDVTEWETTYGGLMAVDASSFEILAEERPADPENVPWAETYRFFEFDPAGEALFALRGAALRVMDPRTLEVRHESVAPFYDFAVGPAPWLSASAP